MNVFNMVSTVSIVSLGLRNVINTYAEYEEIIGRLRESGIKNGQERMNKYIGEYGMSSDQAYGRICVDDQRKLEREFEIERIREI